MTEYKAIRNPLLCPTHPGELLREDVLPALNITKVELAKVLGISRTHLYDILNAKKPVSPEVAARLGKAMGDGADIWLRMQANHDAWQAEHSMDLSDVPRLHIA